MNRTNLKLIAGGIAATLGLGVWGLFRDGGGGVGEGENKAAVATTTFPAEMTLPDCIATWLNGGPLPVNGYVLVGVTCNHMEVWTTQEHEGDVWLVGSRIHSYIGVPINIRRTRDDCDCNDDGLWNGWDAQAYTRIQLETGAIP